ncbi:MAG: siphovirus Gp157 family protein [Acidobacteriaceae bacterium]
MISPSAWKIEQAMATLNSCRQRLESSDDITDQEIARELWSAEGDAHAILRRVISAVVETETLVKAARERIDAIRERQERFSNRAETLRGAVFSIMDTLGLHKIVDAEFTATIRAGSDSVIITDETAIPDEYWRIERKLDKAKLNADVKVGVVIPGAELRNAMPSLAIRTR